MWDTSGRNVPEKGGDWKNRQFSSILRGVFDLGAFSFGSVPPFVPSQNAVFDRESCAHLKGLLFLSWPPPERCSGPVSPSEYAYVRTRVRVCVCLSCGGSLPYSHACFRQPPTQVTWAGPPVNLPPHMGPTPSACHGASSGPCRDNAQLLHELHVFTAEEKSG